MLDQDLLEAYWAAYGEQQRLFELVAEELEQMSPEDLENAVSQRLLPPGSAASIRARILLSRME